MTRSQAIAQIQARLPAPTTEQALALAELADAWTQPHLAEDEATYQAVAEGLAQAGRSEFVDRARADDLLVRPWR